MSIARPSIRAKVAEYTGLGRTGMCSTTGEATTLIDATRLATYAEDVAEGDVVILKFTKVATTISFSNGTTNKINDSGSELGSYRAGDKVNVSGSTSNDGTYTIIGVAAGSLTVTETIATEAAGDTVTLTTYEQNWCTKFDKTTGTVTFAPGGNISTVGHTYEIWHHEVGNVERVNEAISRVLTGKCHYSRLVPLGMLTNADCQSATGWTNGANATASTAAHVFPNRFGFGPNYLTVTTAAANAYSYQTISTLESKTWKIAVLMRVFVAGQGSTHKAVVTIYDVSNSATITPTGDTLESPVFTGTGGSTPWLLLRANFTVPDDCHQVQIRVGANQATTVAHVAFIAVWPADARSLPIPDRVLAEENVKGTYYLAEHANPETAETWEFVEYPFAWPEAKGYGGLMMRFDRALRSGPFFYAEKTFYTALTDDDAGDASSDTDCADDWVNWEASLELANSVAKQQMIRSGPEVAERYRYLELDMLAKRNERAGHYIPDGGIIVRARRV